MKVSRIGWLATLVALAAVVGAVAFAPSADAAILTASTKACTATATPNVFTCTYTVTFTGGSAFNGDTTTVTLTGPATFTAAAVTGVTNNAANCAVAVQAQTTTGYQYKTNDVVAGGCALAATTTVTLTETIQITAATAVTQTANNGFSGTSTTATATGLVFTPPAAATVTKACTAPAIAGQAAGTLQVGTAFTCTVTVTFTTAPAAVVSVAVTNTAATPATATFTCAAAVNPCTFTETLTPTTAGTLPTESVVISGVTFTPAFTGVGPTVLAAGATSLPVTMSVSNCNSGLNTNFNTSGADTTVTCRILLRDAGTGTTASQLVSSGIVTVSLGSTTGVAIASLSAGSTSIAGTVTGTTGTVRCGTVNTNDSCDYVDITITVTAPATVGGVTTIRLDSNYVPDNPALNTTGNLNTFVFTVTRIQTVINCRTVVGIRLVGSGDLSALAQVRPGQIASNDPLSQAQPGGQIGSALGVGILPNGVTVNVLPLIDDPTTTAFDAVPVRAGYGVCPAKFEISSTSGTLLSLSGTLTTNLRILCGSADLVRLASTIDYNTCTTGVTFAVLGLGVGNVEINVRYEPLDGSLLCQGALETTAHECQEFEATGFVTFVAPQVRVILALNPNPVAVGATTTATATLQTLTATNCTAINPSGSSVCIDPTTGRPITAFTDPGSQLNGLVVFTTADASIARFQDVGAANAGTTLGTGVTSTASQVTRECGAFSGGRNTVNPFSLLAASAASPLASFFGGCTEASATMVGVNPGSVNVAAAFIPFLPGAAAQLGAFTGVTSAATVGAGLAAINFFAPGIGNSVSVATLQVAGVGPTGNVNLVRGCNNITPTVSEAGSAYAARVSPASAVIAIWQHNAATNTFTGAPGPASPASAAGVADLTSVTRLTPVFVCVNAAATLSQPPA